MRKIALALPEANERFSHGAPCFFIQDRQPLYYYHDNQRGDGRISVWCPAPLGVPEELVSAEPERFFEPPASATRVFSRWLGVYLDTGAVKKVDWNEVAAILEGAHRNVAPQKLVAELDQG